MTAVITNPAPAPLARVTLTTDSGPVDLVCEPISEFLAITPVICMDKDGNTYLDGTFTLTHRPSGRRFSPSSGCVECCRRSGKALAALPLDWPALTEENSRAWADAIADPKVRDAFAQARASLWGCSAYCDVDDDTEGASTP